MNLNDFKRLFQGLHYLDSVVTNRGDIPQLEIDELTLERKDGGSETFQHIKHFQLECGHVSPLFDFCTCGARCCKECECQLCRRGTCRHCSLLIPGQKPIHFECGQLLERQQLKEEVQQMYFDALKLLGLVKE